MLPFAHLHVMYVLTECHHLSVSRQLEQFQLEQLAASLTALTSRRNNTGGASASAAAGGGTSDRRDYPGTAAEPPCQAKTPRVGRGLGMPKPRRSKHKKHINLPLDPNKPHGWADPANW